MPKIKGCQISHRQLALCKGPVLAIILEAATAGGDTPSFRVIIDMLSDQGIRVSGGEMTAIVSALAEEGHFAKEGPQHQMVYVLPTGERTVPTKRGSYASVCHEARIIMSDEEWFARLLGPGAKSLQGVAPPSTRTFRPDVRYPSGLSGAAGLGASSLA